MLNRVIKLVFILGGALLLVLSILADVLRIGSYPGFNGAQIGGVAAGAVAIALGVVWGKGKVKIK